MQLLRIETEQQARQVFPVMRQLRTHLDEAGYLKLLKAAWEEDGYILLASFDKHQCTGLMGYRILTDFVHGRHLYIDDLVTDENLRSKGIGAALLAEAEKIARAEGCAGLRLCTGVENERGRQFYERLGWNPRALAFKRKL